MLSGIIGLFVFEWFIAGNSPSVNPNANQFAMFSYWALLGFLPKIFSERNEQRKNLQLIKSIMFIHLVTYFIISLVGGLVSEEGYPRFAWVIWTFTISFSIMNIYVPWFLVKTRIRN